MVTGSGVCSRVSALTLEELKVHRGTWTNLALPRGRHRCWGGIEWGGSALTRSGKASTRNESLSLREPELVRPGREPSRQMGHVSEDPEVMPGALRTETEGET